MNIINSGSLEPVTSDNAVLSYDKVIYPDCCGEQTVPKPQTPSPVPPQTPKCTNCLEPNYNSHIETAILKAKIHMEKEISPHNFYCLMSFEINATLLYSKNLDSKQHNLLPLRNKDPV